MGEISGFFADNGGDRQYTADFLAKFVRSFISNGVYDGTLAMKAGSNMQVILPAGQAWINGYYYSNDSDMTFTLANADGTLKRKDVLVLRWDINNRSITAQVLTGTFSSSPVAPAIVRSAEQYDLKLAEIDIPAGATSIAQANITDYRYNTDVCGIVTGVVNQIDTTTFTTQLTDAFNTWFAAMKGQLTTDAAGNLQTEIDNINSAIKTEWIKLSNTFSFVSDDGYNPVISVAGNARQYLTEGMKFSCQQQHALSNKWTFDSSNADSVGGAVMSNIGTPTYAAGKFGNALTLNGSNQALAITDSTNFRPTGDFTLGCWIKTSSTGTFRFIFQSISQNNYVAGFNLLISTTNVLNFNTGKNTGTTAGVDYNTIVGNINVCDGVWHYVTVTVKNNFCQIYVDGKLDSSGYVMTSVYASTNYVRIGCGNNTGTNANFFTGQIDDLFFINGYAMDGQTIKAQYLSNSVQLISFTVTKYYFVMDIRPVSTNSQIYLYGGTDYGVVNSTILNPAISSAKAPFGMDISRKKWSSEVVSTANLYYTPPNATWWSPGIGLNIPIGKFTATYMCKARTVASTSGNGYIGAWTTLSSSQSAETDSYFTLSGGFDFPSSGQWAYNGVHSTSGEISNSVVTAYMILHKAWTNGTINLAGLLGAEGPSRITAVCAYL